MKPDTEDLLATVEVHHPPMLTDISSTKIRTASVEEVRGTGQVEGGVLMFCVPQPSDSQFFYLTDECI